MWVIGVADAALVVAHRAAGQGLGDGLPLVHVHESAGDQYSEGSIASVYGIEREVGRDLNTCHGLEGSADILWGMAEDYSVHVVRVIDGDSVRVRLPDGGEHSVRMYGIDAPEKDQRGGRESHEYLRRVVRSRRGLAACEWSMSTATSAWSACSTQRENQFANPRIT